MFNELFKWVVLLGLTLFYYEVGFICRLIEGFMYWVNQMGALLNKICVSVVV